MHEPDDAELDFLDFEVRAVHQLERGDVLLDAGSDGLSAHIVMLQSTDLSEPGDHGMALITVDLRWRGERLVRTQIRVDQLALRLIARRN